MYGYETGLFKRTKGISGSGSYPAQTSSSEFIGNGTSIFIGRELQFADIPEDFLHQTLQGLVLGMCVFLSWYQRYKLKRLTQGRELWYFWARTGEGIKYFFIARTRKARAERRAHDKTYELSVKSAEKIDRIDHTMSKVEDGILVQMTEMDKAIHTLYEDKEGLIKENADLQVSNAGLMAENEAVRKQLELTLIQYEEDKAGLLASIAKNTTMHERQLVYIQSSTMLRMNCIEFCHEEYSFSWPALSPLIFIASNILSAILLSLTSLTNCRLMSL